MVIQSPSQSIVPEVGAARIGPVPYATTPLIGRETLIDRAVSRIAAGDARLMTLTGPGGIGKTRLAHAIAHRLEDRFRHGAVLVRFASVTDPALVRSALAHALGVPEDRGFARAAGLQRLLVLDNMEQLVDAAFDVVEVLAHCPEVAILVTSRVTLRLSGEHEVRVPPLALPPEGDIGGSDAERLFVERAIAADIHWQATPANLAAVAAITRELDGVPLAIELAAARCRALSPVTVLAQLRQSLSILDGGPADLAAHQHSVQETIAWSIRLLDDHERRWLGCLAVFRGPFSLETAAAVIGDDAEERLVLEACIDLCGKSLIYRVDDCDGEPRFAMLLTIRSIAERDLLASAELRRARDRHARAMLAEAETATGTRHGWFDAEIANLRAALAWLRDSGDWSACARLARAMAPWWLLRSHHSEGLRWLETILGEIDDADATADLLCEAGLLAFRLGRVVDAETWASRALARAESAGDRPATARALMVLANIHDRANDHAEAHPRFTAALAIQRELGDPVAIADTLVSLACIHLDKAEYDDAASLLDEAIALTDPVESTFMHARATDISGIVRYLRRQPGPALDRYDRALVLYRQCGSVRGQALTLDHAGKALSAAGDVPAAWARHRESLPLRQAVGDPRGICVWLEAVAYALLAAGRPAVTFSILACTASRRESGGFLWNGHERIEVGWAREAITTHLDRAAADRAWALGSLWSLDEAIVQAEMAMDAAVRAWRPADDTLFARYGLTPREADVLGCLRRRLTDKQIADELYISPRTASTHVAAILGKLGVRSRRDIPTAF